MTQEKKGSIFYPLWWVAVLGGAAIAVLGFLFLSGNLLSEKDLLTYISAISLIFGAASGLFGYRLLKSEQSRALAYLLLALTLIFAGILLLVKIDAASHIFYRIIGSWAWLIAASLGLTALAAKGKNTMAVVLSAVSAILGLVLFFRMIENLSAIAGVYIAVLGAYLLVYGFNVKSKGPLAEKSPTEKPIQEKTTEQEKRTATQKDNNLDPGQNI